jgi:hypothetical protein
MLFRREIILVIICYVYIKTLDYVFFLQDTCTLDQDLFQWLVPVTDHGSPKSYVFFYKIPVLSIKTFFNGLFSLQYMGPPYLHALVGAFFPFGPPARDI